MQHRISIVTGLLLVTAMPALAQVDLVNGDMFTLTNSSTAPNGVWSWYEDERAIIDDSDPDNTLLLLSSISAGSGSESGDVDLLWRNLDTQVQGEYELHNQLEQDDHDSAALYIRSDGRYVAMYSKHGSEAYNYYRVSTNANDPTSWGAEQTINNGAGTTYDNIYYLGGDNGGSGRLYNFTRTVNYDPTVQVSYDEGLTWSYAGKLLTEGGGGDRPYVKYASDGEKIFFISTDRHPRNYANSIYAGYVQDGVLYNSDGTVIDNTVFDGSGVAPSSLTTVFQNGTDFNGTTMNRAWTINIEVDNTGNPVAIFSARANDNNQDHRFFYARFDGVDWQVNEMALAGGYLYSSEDDYTGLVSIDPSNPNVVYMSSDIDPRTDTGTSKYELYKGVTADFGATWTWEAITENSTVDNLRPVVPEWNGQNTAVAWLRGNYYSYTNWNTEVVGITFDATDAKSLLWRGDAGSATHWDINNTANWDSGGDVTDVFMNGAEVAFDDTASSFTVDVQSTVTPNGVAFNNSANDYTITGAGFGGSGKLRVIGGGTVTLANGANTYTGDTMIAKGTLALSGNATISNSPNINVHSGATLDVTAAAGGSYTLDGQTLTIDGDVNGDIVAANGSTVNVNSSNSMNGDVTVQSGSLIAGAGHITGSVHAQNGTVRVGAAGIESAIKINGLIDNFDGYDNSSTTNLGSTPNNLTGDVWVGVFDGTGAARIVDESGSNQAAEIFGVDNGWRGMKTDLGSSFDKDYSLADGETATYFFQFNPTSNVEGSVSGFDCMFGLTDSVDTIDMNNAWQDFAVMPFFIGNADGTADLKISKEGQADIEIISNATLDTWYNVWLVVDNASKLVDVYTSTGTADGVLGADDATYRNSLGAGALEAFGFVQGTNKWNTVLLDNLYVTSGVNTTNPLVNDWNGIEILDGGETLTVDGDFQMQTDVTLTLDVVAASAHDKLIVGGSFSAAGTFEVVLDASAPALAAGDSFDLLDFTSATGEFDVLVLPMLDTGLFWDTSKLLTLGVIEVTDALPGDLNGDGFVGLDDLDIVLGNWNQNVTAGDWSHGDPSGDGYVGLDDLDIVLGNWNAGTPPSEQANIPEPGTAAVMGGALMLLMKR